MPASNTIEQIQKKVVDFLTEYGFSLLWALIILVIGGIVAWRIGRSADRWLEKKKVEPPIRMLAVRVIRLLTVGLALVLALDKLHVPIAPMIAGISVAGVGVGLAMQGVLGNLVAGLTIIFTKPFRVGEFIEIVGNYGQVQTIELVSTTLLHADQSRVVIPNRKIVGEIMHNYGNIRQLDLTVGVAYGTNVAGAMQIIGDILKANPRVLKQPAPGPGITALGEFSISLAIKPWTAVADYGPAQAEI